MRGRFGVPVYLTTAYLARFADEGMPIALALLAIHRTGSAAQGAFLLTAWMAPHVLTAPLTGSLAKRVRYPRLFYSGALGVFAVSIIVLALTVGRAPSAVTLVVALAGGSCGPIVTGGLSGLLSGLLTDAASLQRGYALDAATFNAAAVTGAAAVTLVAGAATPVVATVVLGGGAVVAALLVAALPYPPVVRSTGGPSLVADLGSGLLAVWRIVELRAITLATVIAFGGIGGLAMTAVLLVDDVDDPGAAAGGAAGAELGAEGGEGHFGGGYLMTAFALGGLVGSLVLARWQPFATVQRLAVYALLGTGAALAAAALVPSFPVRVALFALAGVCDGPLLGATLRLRAEHAPSAVLPQVFTIGAGLKMSAAACGAALTGAAAGLGAPSLLLAIACLQFVAAFLYVLVRSRGARPAKSPAEARRSGVRSST
ncbi:MFS transporter [Streptomyces sp. NPDC048442]|uniref:MFS transporter n=1 Tax=Streptomyces sp. NPDC048442 TaxID=3154823 RepID=UPI00342D88B9